MYFVVTKSYSIYDDPHDPGPDIEYHEYMIDDLGSALIIHNQWMNRNYTSDDIYYQSDIMDESDPRHPDYVSTLNHYPSTRPKFPHPD